MVWTRSTPISCVFLLVAGVGVSGGQPNSNDNAHYLLPATTAWTTSLPAAASVPGALDETHAYIPIDDGQLLALARDSGLVTWTAPVAATGRPVRTSEDLLVPTEEGITALDPVTGRRRWAIPLPDGAVSLTVHSGGVVGMSSSGLVASVDPGRRTVIWQRQLGPSGSAAVAVDAGRIHAVADDGRVVALDAVDGRVLWEQALPGRPTAPAAAGGLVYVGTTDNRFYALDARSGALAWRWRTGGDIMGTALDTRRVYTTALDNRLRAMDLRTGNQRWQAGLQVRPAGGPQVVGSVVVVTGLAPDVLAFDGATGDPVGTYRAPAELAGPVLVDPAPAPYAVSIVGVTRTGQAVGLRPTRLQLAEPELAPLTTLPGVNVPLP